MSGTVLPAARENTSWPRPAPRPWAGGLVVALMCVGFAALFTFSAYYCSVHETDTILPTLISRQNLTLYFWGQNLCGNLCPFFAQWITDLQANLTFQIFVRALCAAVAPLFFIQAFPQR